MTPNAEDIILGGISLRDFADSVNRNMTVWWREQWADLPATFSIHDFVLSSNMIQETIKRTLQLSSLLTAATTSPPEAAPWGDTIRIISSPFRILSSQHNKRKIFL